MVSPVISLKDFSTDDNYSGFLRAKKPRIPRAPSAVNGSAGECRVAGNFRRGTDMVLVVPWATRILVE